MSPQDRKTVVGVDVGGTYTDVFFLNEADGACDVAKVPTTRGDQSQGIRNGIQQRLDHLGGISTIVHGTTVGTNALLERKGARCGVITTKGFRDVLEMRRRDRPQTWGLWGKFEPIVPRDLRVEVDERVLSDGTLLEQVDPNQVQAAARLLLERGAESVCVFFINSYANQENERAAVQAVREIWPSEHVTASSEILPEVREFERASTASLNAYLQPPVGDYLERLEAGLRDGGFGGQVLIVQSNGGVMAVETARRFPVRTALSGPAAGVIAAAHIAGSAGFPNVITCDMGGTSFDVSLIADGKSALFPQTSIDFGMVIRTPMIEITTIGAGGGSIAWVDRGGLLQVGPESAGSDPGPVCYGLGNDRPTVTDANVVMGRINAERPIGGKLDRLDVEASKAAILKHVAEPLGLDVMSAAEAIIRVANAKMAGAIRLVSVERGHDPKNFSAMPFGGGGALHTGALIKDVGLKSALVPRYPGVTSALGCVIADMRHDRVMTISQMLEDLDVPALDRQMSETAAAGQELLNAADVVFEGTEYLFELDMHYLGQTHTVSVSLPLKFEGGTTGVTGEIIRTTFEDTYRQTYGRLLDGIAIRIMNLRVTVVGKRPKFDLSILAPKTDGKSRAKPTGTREVWADGTWHEAATYERLVLPEGTRVPGPAILEQPDTTIFIDPDLEGLVDGFGNLVITRKEEG
ncbi:hydantoinase/oxoprolinase family protein [Denitrobaculum tricleocarpae]|uniref:Hydantoinase/oxoprolinase family protein n=1 Tax=Denitrobaculum tricleocarpae TaxID=2591009 RepID=A0A545TG18_9PROT|nr:hydantoinase/oxoprolinase family protein [Denitrobaculum tricleocarpae]TQV76172.1 hydantoinase/oxoprolinase family protein [Denitrobaculum tricleocarpae]